MSANSRARILIYQVRKHEISVFILPLGVAMQFSATIPKLSAGRP